MKQDFAELNKDRLYRNMDRLYGERGPIEAALWAKEKSRRGDRIGAITIAHVTENKHAPRILSRVRGNDFATFTGNALHWIRVNLFVTA